MITIYSSLKMKLTGLFEIAESIFVMTLNQQVFRSPQFLFAGLLLLLTMLGIVLMTPTIVVVILMLALASIALYIIVEQQQTITALQQSLDQYQGHEDDFAYRTEQLRRTLHDVRSPMSALKLRLHILQKTSCEPDQAHLNKMEDSLERAISQLDMMSDIQKGRVKPTETMQINLSTIRQYLNETLE